MQKAIVDPTKLFTVLISQLTTGARLQLGLDPNPLTGKRTPNLAAAALTIGILETLLFKTAGNLNKAEDKLLAEAVKELKTELNKTR